MMKYYLKEILKRCYYFLYVFFRFPKEYNILNERSKKQGEPKAFFHQLFDMLYWSLRYGEYFNYYYLFGANYKNNSIFNFVGESWFIRLRNEINGRVSSNNVREHNDFIFLQDKELFAQWMIYHDISVPKTIDSGYGRELKLKKYDFSETTYFAKEREGMQGKNIHHIQSNKDLLYLENDMFYILQRRLVQHPSIEKIYPHSINTIRVVTWRDCQDIFVICALQRFGTDLSAIVDNWSAGGMIVPVNIENGNYLEKGILSKKASVETDWSLFLSSHPNTGATWQGKRVPHWDKVKKAAIRAHSSLPLIRSVGWDIVVTKDDVMVLEGNDNWGYFPIPNFDYDLNLFLDRKD